MFHAVGATGSAFGPALKELKSFSHTMLGQFQEDGQKDMYDKPCHSTLRNNCILIQHLCLECVAAHLPQNPILLDRNAVKIACFVFKFYVFFY